MVEVSAFGLTQVFGPDEEGPFAVSVEKVVADGGTGKDTLRFDPGTIETEATGDVPGTEVVEQAGDVDLDRGSVRLPDRRLRWRQRRQAVGGEAGRHVAGDGAQNGSGGGQVGRAS